jgi:hypothetical protein
MFANIAGVACVFMGTLQSGYGFYCSVSEKNEMWAIMGFVFGIIWVGVGFVVGAAKADNEDKKQGNCHPG